MPSIICINKRMDKFTQAAAMETDLATIELVRLAAETSANKKGVDIAAYDVQAASSITSYYLVVSGLNTTHLKALFNETRLALKARNIACWRQSGDKESGWIVADYVDFIIHFFTRDLRAYYKIDELWQNEPRVELNEAKDGSAERCPPLTSE